MVLKISTIGLREQTIDAGHSQEPLLASIANKFSIGPTDIEQYVQKSGFIKVGTYGINIITGNKRRPIFYI